MSTKINSDFVEHRLLDRGMTARDLASESGISEPTMYRILSGKPFRSSTLDKIAEALECNPVDLIISEGHPAPLVEAPVVTA